MRISDWSSDVCSSDLELRLSRCIVGRQEHRCLDCRTPGYCATECRFRPKLERRITRADAKNIDLIRRNVVGAQDVHERHHYWVIRPYTAVDEDTACGRVLVAFHIGRGRRGRAGYFPGARLVVRSGERRGGKEYVKPCRSR